MDVGWTYNTGPENLHWKVIEANKRRIIHKIDRIDNFQQLGCPIVRFRACKYQTYLESVRLRNDKLVAEIP